MRSIEISTAQNVTIEYELATLRDRILAYLIDIIILTIAASILSSAFGVTGSETLLKVAMYLIIGPAVLFYSVFSEAFWHGQSIGKKALGIKVVKLNGEELRFNELMIRWVFRLVDIYSSLGGLATLLISSSQKSQRLGDLLAHTTVIKDKPGNPASLESILKINKMENYEASYPGVRVFSDEDMLLVKKMLRRFKEHPNEAHQQALNQLTAAVSRRLALPEVPKNKIDFLNKVLKDYIVLTR